MDSLVHLADQRVDLVFPVLVSLALASSKQDHDSLPVAEITSLNEMLKFSWAEASGRIR